jgi:hypothetical protein
MGSGVTRRAILRAAAAGAMSAAAPRASPGAPKAEVRETRVISQQPQFYHGWPTVARCRNGRLLVACSGGREAHVCPFGRVELMESGDDGRTWSPPRVVTDSPIDDRDAGVLETAQGTILVTTFTSLAYEPILEKAARLKPGEPGAWPEEKLKRWQASHERLSAEERKARLGVWMLRSTDGGRSWSEPYDCLVSSPHGPVQLLDGRLLYAGKDLWRPPNRVGACESTDDGRTWRWLADLPARPGDTHTAYHELHAVDCGGGWIVVQLRNHNKANFQETLQGESSDNGKTWSAPHPIGVWGLPSHLARLKDGRLLMTYGHRRPPFGCQARFSEDQGRTWGEPVLLSGDGRTADLGYPSTVELADGSFLTVWYEAMAGSPHAVLRQARWA